jgi:isocitrate dehydrogenase
MDLPYVEEAVVHAAVTDGRQCGAVAGAQVAERWRDRWTAPPPDVTIETAPPGGRRRAAGEVAAHRSLVVELLGRLDRAGVDWIETEGLYRFDGELGYALGQGQ